MVLMVMLLKVVDILNRTVIEVVICGCVAFLPNLVIAQQIDRTDINRGAYLARIGDCVACHTAGPQAPLFAGGVPLNSPFGLIYSANITPDPINGIGRYTLDDFSRAVRNGIDKNGSRLYPAMPYKTAQTREGPKPQEMPAFAGKFSDLQIAEVLNFIRNSWGNKASPVTPREVSSLRRRLQKKP